MPYKKKEDSRAADKRYREAHPDVMRARRKAEYARHKAYYLAHSKTYRKEHLMEIREMNRAWRAQFWPALRVEFLIAYGGKCACCGETQSLFLELDHILNNGAEHRRAVGNNQQVMLELKRSGWPKGEYQLLCCNCNRGKALNGGICPHQQKDQ